MSIKPEVRRGEDLLDHVTEIIGVPKEIKMKCKQQVVFSCGNCDHSTGDITREPPECWITKTVINDPLKILSNCPLKDTEVEVFLADYDRQNDTQTIDKCIECGKRLLEYDANGDVVCPSCAEALRAGTSSGTSSKLPGLEECFAEVKRTVISLSEHDKDIITSTLGFIKSKLGNKDER